MIILFPHKIQIYAKKLTETTTDCKLEMYKRELERCGETQLYDYRTRLSELKHRIKLIFSYLIEIDDDGKREREISKHIFVLFRARKIE